MCERMSVSDGVYVCACVCEGVYMVGCEVVFAREGVWGCACMCECMCNKDVCVCVCDGVGRLGVMV